MSSPVPTSSRCPSASAAGATEGHMCRTTISDTRTRRGAGQPAPAANTAATWPPASSKGTSCASNAGTSPMSCSIAATKSSSASNTRPRWTPRAADHRYERCTWFTSAGVWCSAATSAASRATAVSGRGTSSTCTAASLARRSPVARCRASLRSRVDERGSEGWHVTSDAGTTAATLVRGGTTERRSGEQPAARFALLLAADQDPAALRQRLLVELSSLRASVAPLSRLDPRVLVAEMRDRTFEGSPRAAVFGAAHGLAEHLGVDEAEPDLPTPYFPVPPPPAVSPAVNASAAAFPPGCWVPEEPDLPVGWALERIDAAGAWALSEKAGKPVRGQGVVIAQPDTGVTAHAELEQALSGVGWDTLDDDSDPTDPLTGKNPGHGTGTASVAVSRAVLEVSGSAPEALLMPIRAVSSVVEITQVSVAAAIDWAGDHGAAVITMSRGGLPSMSLHRALRRAVAADVIVLAAAGNCVRAVVWPARYDECIAVAGTDARAHMWQGSCGGAAVDVAAPAQNVYRASVPPGGPPGAGIGQGQGTSYAVALTAGVAAVWLAHHGRDNLLRDAHARGETVQAMFVRILRASARRPAGWDDSDLGAGIVDARGLLAADLELGLGVPTAVTAAVTGDPREVARRSVRSLVAETVGPAAADDPAFDWDRHGAELAAALLDRQLGARAVRSDGSSVPAVSPELAADLTNPALRAALRLDDSVPAQVKSADPA